MPTIRTQIRALVLQACLGAALEAEIILLFKLNLSGSVLRPISSLNDKKHLSEVSEILYR